MRNTFFSVLSLLILLLCVSGCTQTTKDYWKTTKGYYYEYLNKPAIVDMEDMGVYSPGEGFLAETMPPLERVLERFKRTLFSLDKPPSDNWMYSFVHRFPWISGVAMIDVEGKVLHQWPSVTLKEHDFSFIQEDKANPNVRHLIGHAEDSALGPEVYVATQIMDKANPSGYFVVYFDPRALFAHVYGSADFMVAAPNVLLWPGKYEASATPVAEADWASLTRGNSSGNVSNSNGEFVWYSIMMGTLPMVFAAPDEGNFPEAPGQMELLSSFSGVESGEAISMAVMTEATERDAGEMNVVSPPAQSGMGMSRPAVGEEDIDDKSQESMDNEGENIE